MKRVNAFLHRSASEKEVPSPSPTGKLPFVHRPLDLTQSSLRLVTVSSELTGDGTIQCYVKHSTLEQATYVCLSYRWGTPGDRKRIIVNGAPFYVQKNVYDFLELVRTLPMAFYWIDALCIDQANVLERNHQVKQMGRTFSRAFLVYLWLGSLPSMAPFMTYFRNSKPQSLFADSATPWNTIMQTIDIVKTCIFDNEYWSRAWVIQEVILARSVLLLAGRESFKFPDLVRAMHHFEHPDLSNLSNCAFSRFVNVISKPNRVRMQNLIHLVDLFRHNECEIPRDRIYSLLSLCSDFQHPEVNYDQPSEDLAFDVLKRSDVHLCTCSALLVAQALCLCEQQGDTAPISDTTTCIEFDIRGLRFARYAMLCNDQILSWDHYTLIETNMFGHDQIFADFCPAFEAVMNALQDYVMDNDDGPSNATDTSMMNQNGPAPPLLRMMDRNHRTAMLKAFGSAFQLRPHETQHDTTTVQIALWVLAKLVLQSISLCPYVAQSRPKNGGHDDTTPEYHGNGLAPGSPIMEGRFADHSPIREFMFHRIDSANLDRSREDEGPVSRPRLKRVGNASK